MKKLWLIVAGCVLAVVLLVVLFYYALPYEAQYEFRQDFEQIEKIEIVAHEIDQSVLDSMEPVKVLDSAERKMLIDALLEMDGGFNNMNPSELFAEYVIRITYRNGEVELICDWTSGYVDQDGELHYINYLFDTEQYCALLSDLLGETVTHPKPQ